MSEAIAKHLDLFGFRMGRVGLAVEGEPSFEEWQHVGRWLTYCEGAVHWWIGDWLNYGERCWGEKYTQAVEVTGLSYSTLSGAKWVASAVDVCRRRQKLTFAHHAEVASLPPNDQDEILELAEREGLNRKEVRSLVRQKRSLQIAPVQDACTVDDLRKLIDAGHRFGTIYADPPWQYDNQATRAATNNHYPTMSVEELAALPVPKLAAPKSHLHLWATDSFLEEAIGLLRGWGYERRQTFVWCKPQLGIGNYWRSNHEYLLLGIRGGLTFPDESATKSYVELPRTQHSAKPVEVRRLVEKVSPGPRLELFGRACADGWVVWGNQIERHMFDDDVKHL